MQQQLENQCISLELAKEMKELGFEQNSLFWWSYCPVGKGDNYHNKTQNWTNALTYGQANSFDETVSAFTVGELGEMLPYFINGGHLQIRKNINEEWSVSYGEGNSFVCAFFWSKSLVNTLSQMLIHLEKNNLI